MQISEKSLSSLNTPDRLDIIELQDRIEKFKTGQEGEEKFKLYRLTRGVYGQRQLGVQMFRLKIPFGMITADQLARVADISDEYATGNLHLTTRQNIQLHYVKLDDSPAVWVRLSELGLTAREACGNTVRNITASPTAGIDPDEAFDVSPYVQAVFEYFLRNPICQEMGRKIKPAFSATDKDTAYTYFSDFGLTPKINDGKRGFKLVIGGGLGALAITASDAFEFIPVNEVIPFIEATLRVFDRYGEREKRQKARMKFLVKDLGIDAFIELVKDEIKSLEEKLVEIPVVENPINLPPFNELLVTTTEDKVYNRWLSTNVFTQKQKELRGVYIKITLGDLPSEKARILSAIIKTYASEDIRITINQNLLLRHVRPAYLPGLFTALRSIGLAEPGVDSLVDITACPGTDTCNLGVTNSTGLTLELEKYLGQRYTQILDTLGIDIKISGCMNACGQHMASGIGFHGSSIKTGGKVIPAMQVVVGGGLDRNGQGHIGQKVIKLPTKKIPESVDVIIQDFLENKEKEEAFIHYTLRVGKRYFYSILKYLADTTTLNETEYMDWGQDHLYNQAIGVGECAGVILDVIGTILNDAAQKLSLAKLSADNKSYKDAIYHAYSVYVISAKATLLGEDIKCNTHIKILEDFQEHIINSGKILHEGNFVEEVLRIKASTPEEAFIKQYLLDAEAFYHKILQYRKNTIFPDKEVVESYYKA